MNDGKPQLNKRTFLVNMTIWMKGSFALATGQSQLEEKHCAGYTLKLLSKIEKLKADPEYIKELKQIIKEREDA